jgi:hypothetical protein
MDVIRNTDVLFPNFTFVDVFSFFGLLKPRSGFRFIKRLGNSNSKHFRSAFKAL